MLSTGPNRWHALETVLNCITEPWKPGLGLWLLSMGLPSAARHSLWWKILAFTYNNSTLSFLSSPTWGILRFSLIHTNLSKQFVVSFFNSAINKKVKSTPCQFQRMQNYTSLRVVPPLFFLTFQMMRYCPSCLFKGENFGVNSALQTFHLFICFCSSWVFKYSKHSFLLLTINFQT